MPRTNQSELVEFILNEQKIFNDNEYIDDEDDENLSDEVLDELLSVDLTSNVVADDTDRRQRRHRRQCPDFFDVVTPDYDVVDGGYIKNLREGINVTKKVFAQIIGVTEETVDDWENDVKRPNNCALRLLYVLNNHIKITGELFKINMKKN